MPYFNFSLIINYDNTEGTLDIRPSLGTYPVKIRVTVKGASHAEGLTLLAETIFIGEMA